MAAFHYLHQIFRLGLVVILSLSLVITPQMVWAANVLVLTSLKEFETDLGNAILKVEGIDSNMQLTVTPRGELTVTRFHTRQVTLRYKAETNTVPTPSKQPAPLPNRINIPLPMHFLSGEIERLTILQGNSTYDIEHIQFDLDADQKNLQFRILQAKSPWGDINSQFQMQNATPFPLNGWMDIRQADGTLPYHLRGELHGDLTKLQITASHHYQPDARPFAIVPASQQGEDVVQLEASIGLNETRTTHFLLHLRQFQARHIHPQMAGHMDLKVTADGNLTDDGTIQVNMDAGDSQLQTHPLMVRGTATLQGQQLMQMDLKAQLDRNQLVVRSDPAATVTTGTSLAWQADFPDLAQFMPGFAGQFNGKGTVSHDADGFHASYTLSGQQLQLPKGVVLAGFDVQGQVSGNRQASLQHQVNLRGLSQQDAHGTESPPIDADLKLTGSLAQHQLSLQIKDADPLLQRNIEVAMQGAWQDDSWQGTLSQLQDTDGKIFQLVRPAAMRWHAQTGFGLQALLLNVMSGQVHIDRLHYKPASAANTITGQAAEMVQFQTSGVLKDFPLQAVLAWLTAQSAALPPEHLRLSAQWDLQLDKQLNGVVQLRRSQGDWQAYDPPLAKWQGLGLKTLSLDLKARNNAVSLSTQIHSEDILLELDGNSIISPTLTGFVVENSAPLSAQLKANFRQLNWFSRLLPDIQPSGSLMAEARATGTVGQPQLQGHMAGQSLGLQIPSQGVWLEQGTLNATMTGHQVSIDSMHFAGKEGELHAKGLLDLTPAQWQLDLHATMHQLQALSRVDRWVQLSGDTQLRLNKENTMLSGQLNIHKGLFELPKADKPKLDEDVIINIPDNTSPPARSTVRFQEFALDFGDKPSIPFKESEQFMLRGQGLNGALSGKMRLNGLLDELNANGTLEVTGTYLAYGQSLNIETGRLIFSGKIPNIGLDILATRQVETAKVGIQINGSLQTPQLKLVSTPETSNENKIALLVLGQPMSAVGSNDMAMLSVAASALLSQGDSVSLQTRIAQTIGLDSIDVRGSGPTSYAVSVGKRINNRLVVGYEKSIVGLLNVGKLTYQLTNRISVETRTGSDNALDVFYGFSFD